VVPLRKKNTWVHYNIKSRLWSLCEKLAPRQPDCINNRR